jgi:hypothetical protein
MSDDPIHDEQLAIVEGLLGRHLDNTEYEGFLIVEFRFVDRFGSTRIGDLAKIFRTDRPEGKSALAASLNRVALNIGTYEQYAEKYPVTIIPPLPAYPLFPILGIEKIQDKVFRILDSRSTVVQDIKTTGRLPARSRPIEHVLRATPKAHWCAYEAWISPEETRRSLQILPTWSNCEARATLRTDAIRESAFVAYSVDPNDPETKDLKFHGYFFEGTTRDHDELDYPGDAVQICVYGEPEVVLLEEWDAAKQAWHATWERSPSL